MKLELTEKKILEALPRIAEALQRYSWIQSNFQNCDVSTDKNFQTKYNGFYRVRRNAGWREHYFEIMQTAKSQTRTFAEVLSEIKKQTGMLEASFASKLVATLNPEKPVIDKFVLANFGLALPQPYDSKRESHTVELYDKLCLKYDELMEESIIGTIRNSFSERYPWARITDIKMLDLILWQIRES